MGDQPKIGCRPRRGARTLRLPESKYVLVLTITHSQPTGELPNTLNVENIPVADSFHAEDEHALLWLEERTQDRDVLSPHQTCRLRYTGDDRNVRRSESIF